MSRLLLACIVSLASYALAFACILDRPLTLGTLGARIDANLILGTSIQQPKLVILAGSNGPYSHRCEVIAPLIGRPCVNAGVAVGVSLDYLFMRWQPALNPDDIVYLPLEEAQYIRPRATAALGPDASIMLRHDRATLWALPLDRRLAALFASDLRTAIMSMIEMALAAKGFDDPREAANGRYNEWGDHIDHTASLAVANKAALMAADPFHPAAGQISAGYGTASVTTFLHWANAHGIRVIGGLPTGFADSPIAPPAQAAIRAIYLDNGATFINVETASHYPRTDFFDTPDHLNQEAQIRHSTLVARALLQSIATVTGPTPAPTP